MKKNQHVMNYFIEVAA